MTMPQTPQNKYYRRYPRLRPAPEPPKVRFVRFTRAEERDMQRACEQAAEFMQHFGSGQQPRLGGRGYFRGRHFLD